MKFKTIKELNSFLNDNKKESVKNIDVNNMTLFFDGNISETNNKAYVTFINKEEYEKYISKNEVENKIPILNAVLENLSVVKTQQLLSDPTVSFVEFIDPNLKLNEAMAELNYTDILPNAGLLKARVPETWARGYKGDNVKIMIVEKCFTNVAGVLDYEEIITTDLQPDYEVVSGSHGDQVASTIISPLDNYGMVGVAPNAKLYGYSTGGTNMDIWIPNSITYAIENGIDIVSMSFIVMGLGPELWKQLYKQAEDAGIIVIGSTGNFGKNYGKTFPSADPSIIGVGGCRINKNTLEISEYPTSVGAGPTNHDATDYFVVYDGTTVFSPNPPYHGSGDTIGTSFCAPVVAGMFALLKQEYPTANKKELMNLLNINGESLPDMHGLFPILPAGNEVEKKIVIRPPEYLGKVKLYPVTESDAVIEKNDRLFTTQAEKDKLAGIEENANNYKLPETLPASMITGLPVAPDFSSKLDKAGGQLENYTEKLKMIWNSQNINLNDANVFHATNIFGLHNYSFLNAKEGVHSFTLIIALTGNNDPNRVIGFPPSVKWANGEVPDFEEANKTYVFTFMTIDEGANWLGMFGGKF